MQHPTSNWFKYSIFKRGFIKLPNSNTAICICRSQIFLARAKGKLNCLIGVCFSLQNVKYRTRLPQIPAYYLTIFPTTNKEFAAIIKKGHLSNTTFLPS